MSEQIQEGRSEPTIEQVGRRTTSAVWMNIWSSGMTTVAQGTLGRLMSLWNGDQNWIQFQFSSNPSLDMIWI